MSMTPTKNSAPKEKTKPIQLIILGLCVVIFFIFLLLYLYDNNKFFSVRDSHPNFRVESINESLLQQPEIVEKMNSSGIQKIRIILTNKPQEFQFKYLPTEEAYISHSYSIKNKKLILYLHINDEIMKKYNFNEEAIGIEAFYQIYLAINSGDNNITSSESQTLDRLQLSFNKFRESQSELPFSLKYD